MFEFIFQGSFGQYSFFEMVVNEKCPNATLIVDNVVCNDDKKSFDHHCSIIDDSRICFEVGMILAACYSKYEHLRNSIFQPDQIDHNG